MIGTIANALAETVPSGTPVELALSGEMGTSLFRYPESYRKIVRKLRQRKGLDRLRIGISLNHDKIFGQKHPTGAPDARLTDAARAELQGLIDECDFVGMSFYRPVRLPPTPDDFVRGIAHFMDEFKGHGLRVPATTPLHFSEVGIGGGAVDNAPPDPAKAVQTPWTGTGNPRENPWREESMQQLRRQYHEALLRFLAEQPARWRVSAAFLWSMGSWDPQGMRQPEFADRVIIGAIEQHNRATGN
jgi:hypothetical protein